MTGFGYAQPTRLSWAMRSLSATEGQSAKYHWANNGRASQHISLAALFNFPAMLKLLPIKSLGLMPSWFFYAINLISTT